MNPHSVHTLNKHKEGIFGMALDNINIVYGINEPQKTIHILQITYMDHKRNISADSAGML